MRIWLGTLLAAIAIANGWAADDAAAASAARSPDAEQSRHLTEFLDAQFDEYLALVPEVALGMGIKTHAGEISDRSEAGEQKILEWRRASVANMQAQFDPARLDDVAALLHQRFGDERDGLHRTVRQRDPVRIDHDAFAHLERLGDALRARLATAIRDRQAPFCVVGAASLFRLHPKRREPREFLGLLLRRQP